MTPYIATEVTIGGYVVEREIARYIQEASISTGVNLRYLLAKAGQESSFTANARAGSTSATGMYQFTNVTWFELFKKNGVKYGYPELAKKISYSRRYRYRVRDKVARKKILSLRLDPRLSALLAAEYARNNQLYIEKNLKRKTNSTDLYLAHFMGPVGAVTLLEAKDKNPGQYAFKLFPRAAKANARIFYKKNRTGRKPRTVREVYKLIDRIFNKAIRRFTNLPPDVFIKIPQVVPTSKKPSEDWFAGYSMVSDNKINFSNGFKDGHSLAEMLYLKKSTSPQDVVDLDSIAEDGENKIIFGEADGFIFDEDIKDIDITSLISDEYLTTADLANLDVVSDRGVNLDEVDAEMADPVFQINRTFFSSLNKDASGIIKNLDVMEISSLKTDSIVKQRRDKEIYLAMGNVQGEGASYKPYNFNKESYSISSEDAAFVKSVLSSLSASPMAEPLTTQAMNTFDAIAGAYSYVDSINSNSLFETDISSVIR
ncbi:MAG: hypothetical protein GY804_12435 [Alphaproteobacteria bacterium]|nr:hypothetical protein [Alphaproteobacteria bacterium]